MSYQEKAFSFIREIKENLFQFLPYEKDINYHKCSVVICDDDSSTIWVKWMDYDCKLSDLPIIALTTVADNIFRDNDFDIDEKKRIERKQLRIKVDHIKKLIDSGVNFVYYPEVPNPSFSELLYKPEFYAKSYEEILCKISISRKCSVDQIGIYSYAKFELIEAYNNLTVELYKS